MPCNLLQVAILVGIGLQLGALVAAVFCGAMVMVSVYSIGAFLMVFMFQRTERMRKDADR